MKTLTFTRNVGSSIYAETATLDDLWEKASRMGKVQVNGTFDTPETVTISFERRTGSRIAAKAQHPDIREAMRLAIEEAITLGAIA